MGLFRVSGRLTGPTGRTATLALLVDTGASLLVVSRALADELALNTLYSQAVQTAGGRHEVWPVAEVRLSLDGREVPTLGFPSSLSASQHAGVHQRIGLTAFGMAARRASAVARKSRLSGARRPGAARIIAVPLKNDCSRRDRPLSKRRRGPKTRV